ncbi:MAG: ATP-binding cassette domain-containing protein [Bacteroidetes bacterium]|nr:ATP-binding cassette domain-containing protein [Bacteroidota bacterium]
MKHLQGLNHYFLKYKWHFFWGILFVAAANYFKVLQPQIIREALDLVFENLKLYNSIDGFESQDIFYDYVAETLLFFGILVLILAFIMGIFMYFTRQTIIVMSRLIEYDMRKMIFAHYQDLDLGFYRKNNTGDLMARITEDVNKVRTYLGPAVLYGINLFFLVGFVMYSMFSVNVKLSIYTLLPLPILSISIYYVSNIINRKSSIIQKQLAFLNSLAQEVYSGIRVVKSYVQEKPMGDYFLSESNNFRDKSLSLAKVNALFYPLMVLLIGTSTILTVFAGGIQVMAGTITPGNIAEFVIYVNMLTWPVTSIGWIASIIQQAEASMERIDEFLKTSPEVEDIGSLSLQDIKAIEFKNVTFTYPDTGITALENLSFKVSAGEKLGIVGKTASGKTTIMDLLVRMFEPTSGSILINGKDIREYKLNELREKIGYVPQDVFLFSDTIEDNISFGVKKENNNGIDRIIDFAKYASVHDDILEFPREYATYVGERGVTLSGGQKQRISIARALIKKPEIVLFDDSLSAVDTKTEQEIISFLEDSLSQKTTIMVTHRLNILSEFDRVIVMEQGKIIEQGSHENLIKKDGVYAQIFDRQQLGKETPFDLN